jgi:hypothetical protein
MRQVNLLEDRFPLSDQRREKKKKRTQDKPIPRQQ